MDIWCVFVREICNYCPAHRHTINRHKESISNGTIIFLILYQDIGLIGLKWLSITLLLTLSKPEERGRKRIKKLSVWLQLLAKDSLSFCYWLTYIFTICENILHISHIFIIIDLCITLLFKSHIDIFIYHWTDIWQRLNEQWMN